MRRAQSKVRSAPLRGGLLAWAALALTGGCARAHERADRSDEDLVLWPIPSVGDLGTGARPLDAGVEGSDGPFSDRDARASDAARDAWAAMDAKAWAPSSGGGPCHSDPRGRPLESFVNAGGEGYVGRPFGRYVSDSPNQVAIGDVSGDGRADIVGASSLGSALVFLQTEDGPLAEPIALDPGFANPAGVALADVDGDGQLDVVVARREGLAIFRSLGSGEFAPLEAVPGPELGFIVAQDLDGDGSAEIVGMFVDSLVVWRSADGFRDRIVIPVDVQGGRTRSWCLGDVDGDSAADLISVLQGAGPGLVVQRHTANETFATKGEAYALGDGGNISCAVGDFDSDGRSDVALAEDPIGYEDRAWVLAQVADGGLGAPRVVSTYGWSGAVGAFDLNNDTRTDLVRIHSSKLSILLQGEAGLGVPAYYAYPDSSSEDDRALALGDINCDGCPDIVGANVSGLVVFYGDGCAGMETPLMRLP
jgi:hypothetical protein